MYKLLTCIAFLLLCGCCASTLAAQDSTGFNINRADSNIAVIDTAFKISAIIFEGNKKTREAIMLRELPFHKGDTILLKDIPEKFEAAKRQLMNTALFHDVNVSTPAFSGSSIIIKIVVKERWYIFPFPYFKPVDRNLNQWLFDKGADIKRVDYGAKLLWDNFTGNNDKLRFYYVTGYTRQIMLGYSRPYFDNSMKWGINANMAIGKMHELNYATIADKQVFVKSNQYLKNFFGANIEATYRPAINTTHGFGFGYNSIKINDTILKLNPAYFPTQSLRLSYPEFYYRISYKNLDYNPYPTKGYAFEGRFTKKGIFNSPMNLWELVAQGIGHWHLGEKYFYSIMAAGMLKLPFKHQPYINTSLQGYGNNYLAGYEYYVIDGVAGALAKASLYRQLTNFHLKIPATKWLTKGYVPLKIFAKAFVNSGYVYNPQPAPYNRLSNTLLNGAGIGIDIFTSYDFTINIEFSVNQLGQNGIYLHKKNIFQ